jgi:hypothetical protein
VGPSTAADDLGCGGVDDLVTRLGLVMVAHHAATQVWRADDTGGEPAVPDLQHRPGSVSRDAIAAEPMLEVQPADSRPTAPAAVAGPVIEIPPSTVVGSAGVPAGFPHTAEGAVANWQLSRSPFYRACPSRIPTMSTGAGR